MKRTAALLAAVATAGALSATTLVATPASAASCSVSWGSLGQDRRPLRRARSPTCAPASTPATTGSSSTSTGKVKGWDVRYGAVSQDGSGTAVPLRGTDLRIVVHSAAYDGHGATYDPAKDSEAVDVGGYRTFRQVAWAGSYEGYSTIGLGVRARLPFRVTAVDGPGTGSRLVIDVAHAW